MPEIYITSRELIQTLKISDQELIDTEHFFDSVPDDEWELIEGKDYKVIVQATGLREYTFAGAYTIAKYLEKTKKETFWDKLKEWFLHTKKKINQAFIRKKILDNCSSLVKRNNQFFISKSNAVAIFCTKADYLKKIDEAARKREPDPLTKGIDYEDFIDEGGLYYSLSGIYKLAQALNESLTKKNRREWCKDVGDVIIHQIDRIVAQIKKRDKNIQTAMNRVKKRDKYICQVTRQRQNKINQLKLAAHHLYSQIQYPYLADVEHNLITLASDVHEQFHQHYMGGSAKSCTIDHFIDFVHKCYPDNADVIIWLEQQKLVLGSPQPVDKRKPHVLYLPAQKVS